MNFIEAIKLARDGNRISRSAWSQDEYIEIMDDEFYWGPRYMEYWGVIPMPGTAIRYIPSSHEYLAEDWEIYNGEPKTYPDLKLYKNGEWT